MSGLFQLRGDAGRVDGHLRIVDIPGTRQVDLHLGHDAAGPAGEDDHAIAQAGGLPGIVGDGDNRLAGADEDFLQFGIKFGADQRISRKEALQLSTIDNAYLDFEEDSKGSLEAGKYADLVVLSGDIMTCPEKDIPNLTVLMTMVNGRIVFQHERFRPAS